MGHNKETFDHWSMKKKPKNAQSTRVLEGTSRVLETVSTIMIQIDSRDRIRGKGMKRIPSNPNFFPIPLVGIETT